MIASDLAIALDGSLLMESCGMMPDAWQRDFLRSQSKRQLLLCTRQAGKSTVSSALAVYTALYQAPALILCLSPSQRQSGLLFRKCRDLITTLGQTMGKPVAVAQESALQMELENGSQIVSLPGKDDSTVRGFSKVHLLLIDESARVSDDLYFAVRPMLATSGGRMVCLSTPFGKRGFFHTEWTEGTGWERSKITVYDCPRIPADFVREEKAKLPEFWFAQEYLCEFRETDDQVFSYDLIQRAMKDDVNSLFAGGRLFN